MCALCPWTAESQSRSGLPGFGVGQLCGLPFLKALAGYSGGFSEMSRSLFPLLLLSKINTGTLKELVSRKLSFIRSKSRFLVMDPGL